MLRGVQGVGVWGVSVSCAEGSSRCGCVGVSVSCAEGSSRCGCVGGECELC